MAENKEGGPDIVGALGEVLGEQLEKQRKKSQPIPEVYSSGMRGDEKPPHLREDANKRKNPKSDDKNKDKNKGKLKPKGQGGNEEEDVDAEGRKTVRFKATPKKSLADQVAELTATVARLSKGQGRQKLKI